MQPIRRTHVFLDVDYTLLNVNKGWHAWCEIIASIIGKPVDEIIQIGSQIVTDGNLYSPEIHLNALTVTESARNQIRPITAEFLRWLESDEPLYEDTLPVLKALKGHPKVESVNLVTFGDSKFQIHKVMPMWRRGVLNRVSFTHAPGQKPARIMKHIRRNDRALFVDDNWREFVHVKDFPQIVEVQMLRDEKTRPSTDAPHQIRTLQEIFDLL